MFDGIASSVNKMTDLSQLALDHKIEGQLYEGGRLEKVFQMIGKQRHWRFVEQYVHVGGDKKYNGRKWVDFRKGFRSQGTPFSRWKMLRAWAFLRS